MFCACGVDGSANAVLVTCSASGSSSGLVGSDGQIPRLAGGGCATVAGAAVGDRVTIGGALIGRSGYTAATVGSAAKSAA